MRNHVSTLIFFLVLNLFFAVNGQAKNDQEFKIFKFENDTLTQTIKIKTIHKAKIFFELTSENKKYNIKSIISGYAIDKYPGMGGENDEDDDGIAYFVIQYIFSFPESDSGLYIRVDAEEGRRVTIVEYNMENFRSKYCPFDSQGKLRLVK